MSSRLLSIVAGALLAVGGSSLAGAAPGGSGAAAWLAPALTAVQEPSGPEARLLPVGKVAPDFTLPQIGGGDVTLGELLKHNKAALLVFWSIDPKEGGDDLPKIQKLDDQLKEKGLAIVAINPRDPKDEVKDFLDEGKFTLLVALDGKATNSAVTNVYRARNLPTYYLLDPGGKVLFRSITLKEAPLKEALAATGLKVPESK